MLVWINGSFGAGKTTLVAELHRRRPEALVYDPERTGLLLRDIVDVPTADFQDLRLWRRQVVSTALGLLEEYGRTVLVPMTLLHPPYLDEVFGELAAARVTVRHFFLRVPPAVLERRVAARGGAHHEPEHQPAALRWAKERIARYAGAADTLPVDTVHLDGERPTAELADEVLSRLDARP